VNKRQAKVEVRVLCAKEAANYLGISYWTLLRGNFANGNFPIAILCLLS